MSTAETLIKLTKLHRNCPLILTALTTYTNSVNPTKDQRLSPLPIIFAAMQQQILKNDTARSNYSHSSCRKTKSASSPMTRMIARTSTSTRTIRCFLPTSAIVDIFQDDFFPWCERDHPIQAHATFAFVAAALDLLVSNFLSEHWSLKGGAELQDSMR